MSVPGCGCSGIGVGSGVGFGGDSWLASLPCTWGVGVGLGVMFGCWQASWLGELGGRSCFCEHNSEKLKSGGVSLRPGSAVVETFGEGRLGLALGTAPVAGGVEFILALSENRVSC